MTKMFLAAGVAALAISAPGAARPGDTGKSDARQAERQKARADRPARTEHAAVRADRSPRVERKAASAERSARMERKVARAERPARADRVAAGDAAKARIDQKQMRAERSARVEQRGGKHDVTRQAVRDNRIDMRRDRADRISERVANRQDFRADRGRLVVADGNINGRWTKARGRGFINGCPPGLYMKNNGCLPPGQAKKLVGNVIPAAIASAALPAQFRSLYPDTSNYYYRYDNGYAYRVNRGSNLIESLLPLLGGGYLPGQFLPNNYMNNYVPSAYSSFYPNTPNQCTRYANGVVYYVDCSSGLVENFMPLYDNGYGVGQVLPSSYGYYNVPSQYRDMYYNTADTGYWYAPGAIYQYDQGSNLITSVAALLSPGLAVGQQLPTGYGAYNVPLGYRDNYSDTPNSWYRYGNGNIYQVDPTTQLVTALVASILT